MWMVWPRYGHAVPIVYSFGSVALSSSDTNWFARWEEH